ncbi:MAG: NAD(P)-binding protein, partial [Myxococcota bacterium]
MTRSRALDTCIIGAGMSGMVMAIRLQQAGKRFRIYEKGTSVGGTWRENTYPG